MRKIKFELPKTGKFRDQVFQTYKRQAKHAIRYYLALESIHKRATDDQLTEIAKDVFRQIWKEEYTQEALPGMPKVVTAQLTEEEMAMLNDWRKEKASASAD